MSRVLMLTVPCEGGLYSTVKDFSAPIRVYADRRIEDDIFEKKIGRKTRERLSKSMYRKVSRAARQNIPMGRV